MRKCWLCKKKEVKGNGSFFFVPKDERRKRKWTEICQTEFSESAQTRALCMDHFASSDIVKSDRKVFLLPSAVPTTNLTSISTTISPSLAIYKNHPLNEINLNFTTSKCFVEEINEDVSMESACYNEPTFNQEQDSIMTKSVDFLPQKYTREQATQTDPTSLDPKRSLNETIRCLNNQIKDLELKLAQANVVVQSMRSIFTEGQIKKIMSPGDIRWKWEDISSAICLQAAGPRAYNHLYKKGFPLPHIKTLQRWCRKINICEGLITPGVDFMAHFSDLESEDKICVLAFDEMKAISSFITLKRS